MLMIHKVAHVQQENASIWLTVPAHLLGINGNFPFPPPIHSTGISCVINARCPLSDRVYILQKEINSWSTKHDTVVLNARKKIR